jgi:ribokinase
LSGAVSPRAAAAVLSRRTTSPVAVTLGEDGVVIADGELVESIPAYETAATDATGAGDTFSAALAVGLSEARPFAEAVRRAQAAAALSTRTVGARTGMPTSDAVEAFLADRPPD